MYGGSPSWGIRATITWVLGTIGRRTGGWGGRRVWNLKYGDVFSGNVNGSREMLPVFVADRRQPCLFCYDKDVIPSMLVGKLASHRKNDGIDWTEVVFASSAVI